MADDEPTKEDVADRRTLTFHYIKSNFFRVLHADGVIGSPGPSGDSVRVCFFSDRVPLPLQVEVAVGNDGRVGDELSQVARKGLVREVDAEIVMSLDVAQQVAEFIQRQVAAAKEMSDRFEAKQKEERA
jgi:hypothetical protein